MKQLITFFALVLSLPCLAGTLSAPFELESASVLPAHIRSPRLKNVSVFLEEKFENDGSKQTLASKLNKNLSWADVINSQDSQTQKNLVEGTLVNNGIDPNTGGPGATTADIKTMINATVPVFSYGYSEKLTLALALPVYSIDVSAKTGFVKTADGQKFASKVGDTDPVTGSDIANNFENPIQKKMRDLGYEPIQSERFSALGDAKIVAKYQLEKSDDHAMALKVDLTLPTGKAPNADKLVDLSTGDGQVDLGATLVAENTITGHLRWIGSFGYTIQFADQIERRIPKSEMDPLSDDKEYVRRDSGDSANLGLALGYGKSTGGFNYGLGYNYQIQAATKYEKGKYERARYDWLEQQNPETRVQSLTAQLGYSTIDLYREKSFAVPLQANLAWARALSGKGATASDVYFTELVLFF